MAPGAYLRDRRAPRSCPGRPPLLVAAPRLLPIGERGVIRRGIWVKVGIVLVGGAIGVDQIDLDPIRAKNQCREGSILTADAVGGSHFLSPSDGRLLRPRGRSRPVLQVLKHRYVELIDKGGDRT